MYFVFQAEVEKKLMQAQVQYDNEKANRQNIETQLTAQLENETNVKKQLQVEVSNISFSLSYHLSLVYTVTLCEDSLKISFRRFLLC